MATRKSVCFLLITGGLVLCFLLAYAALIRAQFGRQYEAEWWIRNVYMYQDYRASTIKEPKILVVAGSNGLFGIQSAILESGLGYPVANLSTHAELDIGFLLYKIEQHLREGDIIILPLEPGYYSRTEISEWFANNMLAWGYKSYLADIDPYGYFRFLTAVPKALIAKRLYMAGTQRELFSEEYVIGRVKQRAARDNSHWMGRYSHESLDLYGEFRAADGPTPKLLKEVSDGHPYLDADMVVSKRFISHFRALEKLARQRQATIIVTWPVSIKNHLYDLSRAEHQEIAIDFGEKLSEQGIDIQCNPALFQMDVQLFFNTRYHTNINGSSIRTKNLTECIGGLLSSEDRAEMDFSTAVEKVQQQTKKALGDGARL